jgi:hypothetical protein
MIKALLNQNSVHPVYNALVVTNRGIRKWINRVNQCGVDGLIMKKRPGRITLINDQQASQLTHLIDQPQQAKQTLKEKRRKLTRACGPRYLRRHK